MSNIKSFILKYIDQAIFYFFVIFLLSLSNSIFVNQLGYYGALILILIKYALTRKHPFSKSGLELALLFYIIALILSTIFSSDFSASFNNFLKRLLLIPIIYTTIASIKNLEEAKKVFKIYLAGTLVTVIVYLYYSIEYFIEGLHGVLQSGPSIFQYPITASEIISFTVIFLFAFLINEKTTLRYKIFLLFSFLLSSLALLSTYKRTGWMGAAFGILLILIIKKQWKIIFAAILLFGIFLLTQKNISEVFVYQFDDNKPLLKYSFPTSGKAEDVKKLDDFSVVSEYNKGLAVYKDGNLIEQIELPFAVNNFTHWKENYYVASLTDTRFVLIEKNERNFNIIKEFYSSGFTVNYASENGYFYILDSDSGLTVFTNPKNLEEQIRFSSLSNFYFFFVDSSNMILTKKFDEIYFYQVKNGIPQAEPVSSINKKFDFIFYSKSYLFIENNNVLSIFKFDSSQLNLIQEIKEVNSISKMKSEDGQLIISTKKGEIFFLEGSEDSKFIIVNTLVPDFIPKNFDYKDRELLLTRVENKQSRFFSIFDPYNQSNFTRIALWQAGLKILMENPLFGVGDIDLANYYKKYKKPHHKEIQGHLHNNFFHFLATLGIFGFFAICFLFMKIILIDIKIIKELKDVPFAYSYSIGVLASFGGFLVSGLTELNFWDHEITTLLWFTFGLNVAIYKSAISGKNTN